MAVTKRELRGKGVDQEITSLELEIDKKVRAVGYDETITLYLKKYAPELVLRGLRKKFRDAGWKITISRGSDDDGSHWLNVTLS